MVNTSPLPNPDEGLAHDLQIFDQSSIIELIPAAALVYNRLEDGILLANRKFLDLTGYSANTIFGLKICNLLPGEIDTNPTGDQYRLIRLSLASGDLILANLRILSMSMTNQIVAMVFSPPQEDQEIRKDLLEQEFRFDNLSLLTTIANQNSVSGAFLTAAEVIRKVVKSNAIAAYLPNAKEKNQLKQLKLDQAFKSDQFPLDLSDDILKDLPIPSLWHAAKNPLCNLHELALVNGYQYLVSLPLKTNDTNLGLLVCAGESNVPDDEAMRYLSLLAAHTTSTIKNLSALEKAAKTFLNVKHIVQIERAITDNLEEGVIVLTPDLKIAEMSPAAELMLGYASKEVFLQKVEMVLIGNETLSNLYKSAQQGISTLVGNNLSLNNRNGNSFMAQVLCIPVTESEVVKSIVLILRDLSQTEQIRARSQQLEQRAFLGEVSAIFAHEVKNPINSISTGLQYIGMTMNPDNPHYQLVNRLQNDCLRLTHLMESTLSFSKPMEYHFYPVDLSELISSILDRWGPRMTRLNIKYNFDISSDHPMVLADSRALEQVFVNLVSNATQAMESEGGTLNIKIAPAESDSNPAQYEIIVADSGAGIPDELKEHIFEPFVTTKSTGTGLGLAISKRIVTAHKGNIYVESFPGGTMFHILLPKSY